MTLGADVKRFAKTFTCPAFDRSRCLFVTLNVLFTFRLLARYRPTGEPDNREVANFFTHMER